MVRAAALALVASLNVTGTVRGHTDAAPAVIRPSAVGFFTARDGLLAFPDGRVVRTRDGGRTWTRGRAVPLEAIDVVSRGEAFGVHGRTLLRTFDGGRSWRRVAALPFAGAVDFADEGHGWLAGPRGVRTTGDGGRTWRPLRTPCRGYDSVHVALADAAHGFVLCGGQPATIEQGKLLYATSDGGRTWRLRATTRTFGEPRVAGVLPATGHAAGMVFRDPRHGVVIADRAGLYSTEDGGVHWRTALFTDDSAFVAALAWPSLRTRYALTGDELARQDGPRGRWRLVYPHTLPQPNVFAFADVRHGVGAGRGGFVYDAAAILATADGGRTWRLRGRIPGAHAVAQLERVSRTDLYAIAAAPGWCLFRSHDDGRTWTRLRTPRGAEAFTVAFPSPRRGFLGDTRRRLYATADGGRSWRLVSKTIGQSVLAFGDARTGYALVDQALHRTRDGGANWRALEVPSRPLGVAALGTHAWVVSRGAIFRTRDSGGSWQRIVFKNVPGSSEVDFVSANVGFAKDAWSGLYRTRDGGRTWRYVSPASP